MVASCLSLRGGYNENRGENKNTGIVDHHLQLRLLYSPRHQLRVALTTVFLSQLAGYDVSNVANIQPRLYEAFGDIKLLPWIGLSYSLSFFAVLSFARKIIYCFDMRWIYLTSLIVFIVGAAVAGAAPNMSAIIVGRVIMGLGGALVQQRYSHDLVISVPLARC